MKRLLLTAAFCAAATPALALFDSAAPGVVQIVDPTAPTVPLGTVSHPLNTTGTFSGTIGGFQPSASPVGTPVSAQTTVTTGSTQTLPTGTVVVATNVGTTNMAYCQLGATASANSQAISPNGGWFAFTVGSATQLTCVTTASTTTVNVMGGAGIPTGTGGGGGGAGGSGAITAPLGTQAIGASVAVTPATSSVWSGPLGAQAIGNSQAVNPATSSVWSVTNGPNQASITGNITVVDSGVTCAVSAASQTICTGTPTASSFVTGQINGAGCIGVSSTLSGGTVTTATMTTEVSQDNVTWVPRGVFLDGKNAPIWINNATGGVFSGVTPGGGVLYYRVRASALTVATGSPTFAITLIPSQASCMMYAGNVPTAGNGSQSVASVNIQGGGASALNVGVNQIQQAGATLAAPTAPGTPASSGLVPTVNVANPGTAGIFTPDASYSTSLSVTNTSQILTLPASATTGSIVKLYNRGPNTLYWTPVVTTGTATTAMSMLAPNSTTSFTVATGVTGVAAIVYLSSQSATLNAESGVGVPADTGGPINQAALTIGQTVVGVSTSGGDDNSNTAQAIGATAAGVSATHNAMAVQGVTSGVPIPISGTVTASFSQFAPNGNYSTPLIVGATSSRTALPSGGGLTVAIYNVGENAAFVILGDTSVVATAADDQVAPGGFLCLAIGSNVDIAAIETAGATTLNISGGSGGCAGSGGGGGSSGSSGNVFQANLFDNSSASTATTTQRIAASGSTVIYLVNYSFQGQLATGTFQIVSGSGTNCATSQISMTPLWDLSVNAAADVGSLGVKSVSAAGAELCVKTTSTNPVSWNIGVVQQ